MNVEPSPSIPYDDATFVPFHVRVCVASTAGVFADGFGLGIIGIALSLAQHELRLTPLWLGLLGGASLAGLFAGALLTGPVADRFGRRGVFTTNMMLLAVLSATQFIVQTGIELLLLRLAIGCLLGTDYVVSKTLLSEFVPRRYRGRILGQLSIAWAGGYACAYIVGFMLADGGTNAWRWMLLSSAAPCLLIAPLRLSIPESPLWLVNHGRAAQAASIVRARLGVAVRAPVKLTVRPRTGSRWRQLFSHRWRVRTLVACTFFACQVVPYFALGTFVTQVMSALHFRGGYVGGLVYNLALLAGAIGGVLLVDRISRRLFLVGSFVLATLTMLPLSIAAQLPPALMVVLFAAFAGVISAASNLVYVYLPELFPTDLRASGIGLAVAASRIGSAAATFVLPIIVVAYGVHTALGACVGVLAVGAVVCYRWAPETRNMALESLDEAQASAPL